MNKAYWTVAGSILIVESRHSSYIRAALGESPFPKPYVLPATLFGPENAIVLIFTTDLILLWTSTKSTPLQQISSLLSHWETQPSHSRPSLLSPSNHLNTHTQPALPQSLSPTPRRAPSLRVSSNADRLFMLSCSRDLIPTTFPHTLPRATAVTSRLRLFHLPLLLEVLVSLLLDRFTLFCLLLMVLTPRLVTRTLSRVLVLLRSTLLDRGLVSFKGFEGVVGQG